MAYVLWFLAGVKVADFIFNRFILPNIVLYSFLRCAQLRAALCIRYKPIIFVVIVCRQAVVRQSSDSHDSVRFVNYCKACGIERLFSLILPVGLGQVSKITNQIIKNFTNFDQILMRDSGFLILCQFVIEKQSKLFRL